MVTIQGISIEIQPCDYIMPASECRCNTTCLWSIGVLLLFFRAVIILKLTHSGLSFSHLKKGNYVLGLRNTCQRLFLFYYISARFYYSACYFWILLQHKFTGVNRLAGTIKVFRICRASCWWPSSIWIFTDFSKMPWAMSHSHNPGFCFLSKVATFIYHFTIPKQEC